LRQRAAAAGVRCFTGQLPWRCASIVAVDVAGADGTATAAGGCADALGEGAVAAERRFVEKREKMLNTVSCGLVGRGLGRMARFGP
jgi:hypothetical protein